MSGDELDRLVVLLLGYWRSQLDGRILASLLLAIRSGDNGATFLDMSGVAILLNGVDNSPPMLEPSIIGTTLTTGFANTKADAVLTV